MLSCITPALFAFLLSAQSSYGVGLDLLDVVQEGVSRSDTATLKKGEQLRGGERLQAAYGIHLDMQPDGNLILRDGLGLVWTTRTGGHPGAFAAFQNDGNFVIYHDGKALWSTKTGGQSAVATLSLQEDCNLVMRTAAGDVVWASDNPCNLPPPSPAPEFDCSSAGANYCARRLGATHWAPCYFMDASVPALIDGALQVASMGSRIIKVAAFKSKQNYPWNSPAWPEDSSVGSLLDIVQHEYYRQLWDMDFDTFVLVAYSTVGGAALQYWRMGITPAQEAEEEAQFKAAAAWLLQRYPGKEFIFENWEGDWASRGHFNKSQPATDLALTSMTKWLAARQKGVTEARAAHRQAGAKGNVFFAAEVNRVIASLRDGQPNMVNRVLPNVALDMVSYSSYDSQDSYTDFKDALQYLQQQHVRTADSPSGFDAVFVAEYGKPQMKQTQAVVETTVRNVVNTALGLGVRHVIFWETFCNECTDETDPGCINGHCPDPAHPVTDETKLNGFWLVRPNGTMSWPRQYLASKIGVVV